jgi:8-oxo-dGTP pyrophosphatase MutT (NUDIX family)
MSDSSDGPVPPAVPIRDASTVLLLRDEPGAGPPSVWMLTRAEGMVFAAGASVFPGGRVHTADAELPWSGRAAQLFADDFGCELELSHALVGAAVRETFEETGVLLANPLASLAHRQREVEDGQLKFGELLAEHDLPIDADALRPWSRWITPLGSPRRYDTRFFVAAMPAGAEAADLSTESVRAEWKTAAEALAEAERGERTLMFPTKVMLTSIAPYGSVAEIMQAAAQRSLEATQVALERDAEGRTWAVLPDGTRELGLTGPPRPQ